MKIYTKTGDSRETSLIGGERVSKAHVRLQIYGEIDSLNAHIGLIKDLLEEEDLKNTLLQIQSDLFVLGTEFAATDLSRFETIQEEHVLFLEKAIDQMSLPLQPQKSFILPGGSVTISQIHIARTLARKTERKICDFDAQPQSLKYINRLSDYLFILARYVHHLKNVPEIYWKG